MKKHFATGLNFVVSAVQNRIIMRKALLVLVLGCFVGVAYGQFKEGVNYDVVAEKATAEPTVTEFFSLFCGHCFQFEPLVGDVKEKLKEGTKFEKSHVDYIPRDNPDVQLGIVKAFVIMDEMGDKGTEIMQYFFNQIHLVGRVIDTNNVIKQMFWEQGVSKENVEKLFSSKDIEDKAKKMARVWEEKQITNVPTLLVNGKYKINMSSVRSIDELMELVNFLVDKK